MDVKICDICKKNKADTTIEARRTRTSIEFARTPINDWMKVDMCNECYSKLFGRDLIPIPPQ